MSERRASSCGRPTGLVLAVAAVCLLLVVDVASAQPASVWESQMSAAVVAQLDGRLGDAEVALREGLADAQRADPDGLQVAATLNALAIVVSELGRAAEAVAIGRPALAIRERQLGPGHPEVAIALNNLAAHHALLRRYPEAATLYLRALAVQELSLGPDDTSTVTTVRNLAALYVDQRKYAEAAPLVARVVKARNGISAARIPR